MRCDLLVAKETTIPTKAKTAYILTNLQHSWAENRLFKTNGGKYPNGPTKIRQETLGTVFNI